jgi:hypothetical protein
MKATRKILSCLIVAMAASAAILNPVASRATVSEAQLVIPGSVSAIITSTSGSPDFTTTAQAAGWSPTATITVEYKYFRRPYSTQPWALIYTGERTCGSGVTSCSIPRTYRSYNGYVKVEARAWGAGGAAENNPSIVTRRVGNPPTLAR